MTSYLPSPEEQSICDRVGQSFCADVFAVREDDDHRLPVRDSNEGIAQAYRRPVCGEASDATIDVGSPTGAVYERLPNVSRSVGRGGNGIAREIRVVLEAQLPAIQLVDVRL